MLTLMLTSMIFIILLSLMMLLVNFFISKKLLKNRKNLFLLNADLILYLTLEYLLEFNFL